MQWFLVQWCTLQQTLRLSFLSISISYRTVRPSHIYYKMNPTDVQLSGLHYSANHPGVFEDNLHYPHQYTSVDCCSALAVSAPAQAVGFADSSSACSNIQKKLHIGCIEKNTRGLFGDRTLTPKRCPCSWVYVAKDEKVRLLILVIIGMQDVAPNRVWSPSIFSRKTSNIFQKSIKKKKSNKIPFYSEPSGCILKSIDPKAGTNENQNKEK